MQTFSLLPHHPPSFPLQKKVRSQQSLLLTSCLSDHRSYQLSSCLHRRIEVRLSFLLQALTSKKLQASLY